MHQIRELGVMRRRHPRYDIAIELARTQNDARALQANGQVGQRDLLVDVCAGLRQAQDLVAAQHRSTDDIAGTALRQVHDFREQRPLMRRLLALQPVRHGGGHCAVSLAEASEKLGPRGAGHAMQRNDGAAIQNIRCGGCGNAGHYSKKWWQRFLRHRERVNV